VWLTIVGFGRARRLGWPARRQNLCCWQPRQSQTRDRQSAPARPKPPGDQTDRLEFAYCAAGGKPRSRPTCADQSQRFRSFATNRSRWSRSEDQSAALARCNADKPHRSESSKQPGHGLPEESANPPIPNSAGGGSFPATGKCEQALYADRRFGDFLRCEPVAGLRIIVLRRCLFLRG